MNAKKTISRLYLLGLILSCYFLPLSFIVSYHVFMGSRSQDWTLLSLGLFLSTTGSLILFLSMALRESSFRRSKEFSENDAPPLKDESQSIDPDEFKFAKLSLAEAQSCQIRLLAEIDTLTADLNQAKAAITSHEKSHRAFVSELEEQQLCIRNLHETIAEQKAVLDKKQQHTSCLESKVGDLTYEIKTLLALAEAHNSSLFNTESKELPSEGALPHPKETPLLLPHAPPQKPLDENVSEQLKKCINIAQKITGSQRFGSQLYSFLESPAESFSIDLRRLCDRLRMDITSTNCTVLLYSPKTGQLLFAGSQIRDFTGWSPEKFTQTFNEILQDEAAWNSGIHSLSMRSEANIQLGLKTRSGQTASFDTCLGMIPTGIFRNHIIALLLPAQ